MAVWFFLALVRDMNGSEAKNILLLLFMPLLLTLLYSLLLSSVVISVTVDADEACAALRCI